MECITIRCANDCRVWMTLAVVLIYAFAVALCGASLTKSPNNKAVIAGQQMEMECQADSRSLVRKWDFLQVGSQMPRTIAINDNTNIVIVPNISSLDVDVDHNSSFTLYSNSTETKDAGVYICQGDTGSKEFKYSAQLIVFESDPLCETNLTANTSLLHGDYIWMQCRVNFRGNWAPTMEWRRHPLNGGNNEGPLVSNETVIVVAENSSITSTLIVLIDSTNYDSYYSCRTYFTWHNGRLRTNATNVPDFSHTWTTNWKLTASPTTSTSADTNSKGEISKELVLILFGVLSVTLLLMMMATVAVCCVMIRRKTAEWMAQVVSTYENRERPRSVRDSRGFSLNTLRRQWKANSKDQVERPEREPSDGYASVDDLTEECNQAMGGRPTTSQPAKYTAVFKKRTPPAACAASASAHYSMAKEDVVLDYATLRKNIEPPKWDTDVDSDSESEDLK